MTYCGNCKCKISDREAAEYAGACQICHKTIAATTDKRYALKDVKRLVGAILELMEGMAGEYGSLLSDFDRVEIADVAQDIPALKKHIGHKLDPMAKARLILTAAAYQNFKRGENTLENLCQPLLNYPELSVPADCIAMDIRTKIKISALFFQVPGEPAVQIHSQRVWDTQKKRTPQYCFTKNILLEV